MKNIKNFKQFNEETIFNQEDYKISNITKDDLGEVIELAYNVFKDLVPESKEDITNSLMSELDYDLFFKVTNKEGMIIGTYQLCEVKVCEKIQRMKLKCRLHLDVSNSVVEKWRNITGIEGVQLSLLPEYRDRGIGKLLINHVSTLGYPYIFGQHYETLGNMDHWAKRRKILGYYLVGDNTKIYLTLGDYESKSEPTIELIHQKEEYTCGNTVLEMLCKYYGLGYDIQNLIDMCGTNSDIGTTGEMMLKGIKSIKFAYTHLTPGTVNNLKTADELIGDKKDFLILRGLVRGVKHWVLVSNIKDGKYEVYDTWLGHYFLDKNQIIEIWKPRQYEGFIIHGLL